LASTKSVITTSKQIISALHCLYGNVEPGDPGFQPADAAGAVHRQLHGGEHTAQPGATPTAAAVAARSLQHVWHPVQ